MKREIGRRALADPITRLDFVTSYNCFFSTSAKQTFGVLRKNRTMGIDFAFAKLFLTPLTDNCISLSTIHGKSCA